MNNLASEPLQASAQGSITITLPDGSTRAFPSGVTGIEIAKAISKSLAKAVLVVEVDGELWDLDELAHDCAADGVYEFLFTSAPLNLHQGVASPPNALAVK